MRHGMIIVALLALGSLGYAEFIDTPADSISTVRDTMRTSAPQIFPAAATIPGNLGRHHIALGILGYFKASSDDFTAPDIGFDASEGSSGFFNYRYSFTEQIELAVDVHGWVSEEDLYGIKIQTLVSGFGLGARYNIQAGHRVYPYVQLNVYDVTETVTGSIGYVNASASKSGFGFGANAGAEIRLGKLIAIPVEVMYLLGKPADDVSGFGVSAGISFNWGRIE